MRIAASLFEKYGGFAAISKAVMAFYEKVLDSERIGPHFDNIDMPQLVDHQTKFISSVLGGPASFTDERLRMSHRNLAITHDDMDEMVALLRETLAEHGFSAADAEEVVAAVERRREVVVSSRHGQA